MNNVKLIGFNTIAGRELLRIKRIWIQTLVPPVITMALYFVIFGRLIGGRIGAMDGFNYIEFIAPGLIMMSIISNSYGNVVSSFYGSRFGHYIEELLIAPQPNWIILLGYITGGLMRGLLVGALVSIVALFFTKLSVAHAFITITSVLLTSLVFSLAGFINAVFAKNFEGISIIPNFVLTPLTYLGGVFYSISLLPPFWESVSRFNPILYMVNAFRYGILGKSDIPIVEAYAVIVSFAVVLFGFCLWVMHKGYGLRE